ncbi:MAG: methylenetetrahydrofolate reductase [Bacteroidales bacterium]|jgi:methylenetetrahydrofolate reductase (NADPH)|nr:methylenetetrahydrofolate reductase [Bacteroidales bacterium]
MDIALELVPQSEPYIREQTELIGRENFPISIVNFPDLIRFDIRSWEACRMISFSPLSKIPHLRAMDFDLHLPFPLTGFFLDNKIEKVLVIEGDKPQDVKRKTYPATSIELIRKLKNEAPGVKIYAGFDPYRNNIRYEMEYLMQKAEAGAEGFFSQPFFDLRLLEIYSEYMSDMEVFWGICPVIGEKSRLYWEIRNSAIFPKTFEPTMNWNIRFGKQVIDFCLQRHFNLYLMPIRIDLEEYLKGLFSH